MPNGDHKEMYDLAEEYIYITGLDFIRQVLKRKTYDVGSVELKFYQIAKNVARLFDRPTDKKYKIAAYELIRYIHTNKQHEKYLDNVRHPARNKNNREVNALFENNENEFHGGNS